MWEVFCELHGLFDLNIYYRVNNYRRTLHYECMVKRYSIYLSRQHLRQLVNGVNANIINIKHMKYHLHQRTGPNRSTRQWIRSRRDHERLSGFPSRPNKSNHQLSNAEMNRGHHTQHSGRPNRSNQIRDPGLGRKWPNTIVSLSIV